VQKATTINAQATPEHNYEMVSAKLTQLQRLLAYSAAQAHN